MDQNPEYEITRDLDFTDRSKNFLEFRKNTASRINEFCERFYSGKVALAEIEDYFAVSKDMAKVIAFVLESFAQPNDPGKARRKDGSHIAVHSLQLFKSARDFFAIHDAAILQTVLVHDILEDTRVTDEEIKAELGDSVAQLAMAMTEERLVGEETDALMGRKAALRRFIEKLRRGGPKIAAAELIDRIDDISDLAYLTAKLQASPPPERWEKIKNALVAKFAKCQFTVDSVCEGLEGEATCRNLKDFFNALCRTQLTNLNEQFGLGIAPREIEEEKDTFA